MAPPSATLPPLIQQMLVPGFYPHPTADSITLIQTHISYVLLTGSHAYKVKKPVNLGFTDFAALDRRHHFLLEELRLNRRGAPGIYLDVLPISVAAGGFRLGDSSDPVEYALKMTQFTQEALFTSLLKQGKVDDCVIESLARTIAGYHQNSRTDETISQFGQPERVRAVLNDNYRQTERFIGGPQTAGQFEQTRKFTEEFYTSRRELLQQRVAGGFIRECHGDLHLRNICLWQEKILLFDCIEFNEAFRFIDVMQDIAFTIMDLEAYGRSDLAWLLLNTYAELTGDWEGLRVLPLYLTRHAYVRAKINSLMLEEAEITEAAKQEALQSARSYYRQAWNYAQSTRIRSAGQECPALADSGRQECPPHQNQRPMPGRLILVCGLSGAGKSTVARYLGKHLHAVHIRSDAVRKHIAGLPLDQRGGPELYTADMTSKTYHRLLHLGMLLARDGFTVVLDAKYDRREHRHAVEQQADAAGIPWQIVHCTAPTEVRRERLLKRRGDISDATVEVLDSQAAQFEEFSDVELPRMTELGVTGDAWLTSPADSGSLSPVLRGEG